MCVVLVIIHHLAELSFIFSKCFPPQFCPLAKALRELRQGNPFPAAVEQCLCVLIIRTDFKSFLKVPQCTSFLIQIVIGVSHAEVPEIVVLEVFFMGLQKGDCLLEPLPVSWISNVVVGAGKLTVHLRCPFFIGNRLQCIYYLLELVLLMPLLALL